MAALSRRVAIMAAALGLALFFAAAAIGFACAAIDLALSPYLSPPLAALGAAGAALVLALLILALGRWLARPRRSDGAAEAGALAAALGALLGKEGGAFAAAHPRGTVVGSLVAGFAVGADPSLRRVLRGLLDS